MYLVLERPWVRPASAPAQVAATPRPDAGPAPKKPRKRRGARGPGGGAAAGTEVEIDPAIVLTDADRRLEWRGDAVELPKQTVDMGGGAEGRALEQGEINQAIQGGSQPMLDCIVRATGQAPLTGAVTLKLLVDPQGRVTKTRVQAPAYLFAHDLLPCARRAAQSLGFPGTGAYTVVTAPFELY